jgi:hypothetical protein
MRWPMSIMLAVSTFCVADLPAISGFVTSDALAQRRDDRRGGRPGNWVELGCQQVSFIGRDRDTIRVGRREGRFKAIRLKARGNDVEVLDLKVVYSSGAPDDISVRSRLRAGGQTRPLDLKGRQQAIDRVEMVYKSLSGDWRRFALRD